MEKACIKDNKLMLALFSSSLLFISIFFSSHAHADNGSTLPGTQLAYFIGYHSYTGGGYNYPAPVYYGPQHDPRRSYWTHWRRIGYACRQKCLINGNNNRVIRCIRRCYD